MKKIFLLLVTSMVVGLPLSAQWLVNGFESTAKDSMFTITKNSNAGKKFYFLQYDTVGAKQGSKAYKTSWKLNASEGYGGNDGFEFKMPRAKDSSYYAKNHKGMYRDSTYMNFGAAKYVSIWFNNLKKSSAAAGAVQMRLKLHDAGGDSKYWGGGTEQVEDWYFQTDKVYDSDPGWKQLIVPLKDEGAGAPDDLGFHLPGWSGTQNDGVLNLNKIIGFTVEWTANPLPGDSTANGEIMWDNMQLLDYAYQPIYKFNNFTQDTANFNGIGFWGDKGGIKYSEEKVDTLIAPSALAVAYKVNCSNDWGGFANFLYNYPAGQIMPDLSSNQELVFFVKVVDPMVSSTGVIGNVMSMRFVLREGDVAGTSAGGDEWFARADVRLDSVGKTLGWQMVSIPLVGLPGSWGEFAAAPFKGFYAVNGSDNVMNLDKIKQFKIEFSASRDAGQPFSADLVYSGKVMFSSMLRSGFRNTDKVPPAPVTGILATKGSYTNLVTWSDVPSEPGSTYDVYASLKTFASTSAVGVEHVPYFGLPVGTQFNTHVLRAATKDKDVTYYYGVTATDANGNTNAPVVIGPIVNKAQGVPVISWGKPSTLAVDGALGDWASVAPIVLNSFRNPAVGHMAPNGQLKDSLDLSVKAYIAMDANNLYVAFDVVDDTVSIDTTATSYQQDSPDLFLGFYDSKGDRHKGYSGGARPDYHFRFSQNFIMIDNKGGAVVEYAKGSSKYVWKKKTLSSGYTIEAAIPFSQIAALAGGDSTFVAAKTMQIPIDFSINDRDGKNDRDCIFGYSPFNDDNSWADQYRWTYTWIGDDALGVSTGAAVPESYSLDQNFPNPFNPTTSINYRLAKSGLVSLKVYDVLGREVATLVNGVQDAGVHNVQLNGTKLASGMYLYKIESGSFSAVKKMMLLK
ncbi:MAG: sugar-binding protein [Bacteroidota bacterium]